MFTDTQSLFILAVQSSSNSNYLISLDINQTKQSGTATFSTISLDPSFTLNSLPLNAFCKGNIFWVLYSNGCVGSYQKSPTQYVNNTPVLPNAANMTYDGTYLFICHAAGIMMYHAVSLTLVQNIPVYGSSPPYTKAQVTNVNELLISAGSTVYKMVYSTTFNDTSILVNNAGSVITDFTPVDCDSFVVATALGLQYYSVSTGALLLNYTNVAPNRLTISDRNLWGTSSANSGTINIYKLHAPDPGISGVRTILALFELGAVIMQFDGVDTWVALRNNAALYLIY